MDAGDVDAALAEASAAVEDTVETLSSAGVADEALADYRAPRRRFGVPRRARLTPVGRVWRLGVLLVDRDGGLYAAGATTRAVPPGHPQHVAVSQEQRRQVRAAAFRGRFEPGETINLAARRIVLASSASGDELAPLVFSAGHAYVRWSAGIPGAAAVRLDGYLRERVALLLHPPEGA